MMCIYNSPFAESDSSVIGKFCMHKRVDFLWEGGICLCYHYHCMRKHACTREVWGHAPQENFFEAASGDS
jgi:hypothetical protein